MGANVLSCMWLFVAIMTYHCPVEDSSTELHGIFHLGMKAAVLLMKLTVALTLHQSIGKLAELTSRVICVIYQQFELVAL